LILVMFDTSNFFLSLHISASMKRVHCDYLIHSDIFSDIWSLDLSYTLRNQQAEICKDRKKLDVSNITRIKNHKH